MATHKSAEKRIRQTERRTAVNRARVSRLRTFMKKVEAAIESGDKEAARAAFSQAQPELHRRLNSRIKAL
jgi:small subunit ribosomal protein S20